MATILVLGCEAMDLVVDLPILPTPMAAMERMELGAATLVMAGKPMVVVAVAMVFLRKWRRFMFLWNVVGVVGVAVDDGGGEMSLRLFWGGGLVEGGINLGLMSFAYPHLILVRGGPEVVDAVAAAAEYGFAQWQFSHVGSLDEAERQQPSEAELLVVVDGDEVEKRRAREVRMGDGLPRWGLVCLTEGVGVAQGLEEIPVGEWHAGGLARHLRHALTELGLRRCCERHEGDLRSIARRIRHDLNGPLNGILTVTELIEDMAGDGLHGGEVKELAGTVYEAIDGMVALIERVSLLAKASSVGRERERVMMVEPLAAALERLESVMMRAGGEVELVGEMPVVRGVEEWLRVVWEVLIANAIKHGGMPPRVRVGWVEVEDGLKFWVEDNGAGVDERGRAGLFKPFHLLHEDNRAYGLGLSLVQRLVVLQGGRCGAEMVEGGFRFFFVLPKELL